MARLTYGSRVCASCRATFPSVTRPNRVFRTTKWEANFQIQQIESMVMPTTKFSEIYCVSNTYQGLERTRRWCWKSLTNEAIKMNMARCLTCLMIWEVTMTCPRSCPSLAKSRPLGEKMYASIIKKVAHIFI